MPGGRNQTDRMGRVQTRRTSSRGARPLGARLEGWPPARSRLWHEADERPTGITMKCSQLHGPLSVRRTAFFQAAILWERVASSMAAVKRRSSAQRAAKVDGSG